MRNHGESDHHDSMTYHEMADDVARTLDLKGINKCTLLGHSMGAKVAMTFAINYPDRLNGLIVVDSAPIDNRDKSYIYSNTKDIIDKVYDYNIDNKSRKEVVEDFKKMFRGPTANLLNTNLTYVDSKSDKIKWRINLKAIKDNIDNILGFEYKKGKFYKGPIKVLVGEKSFIFDIEDYKKIFPDIKEEDFAIIKNAGHWLHSDQPAQTIKEISSFLDKIDTKDLYNL
jgi:esterase